MYLEQHRHLTLHEFLEWLPDGERYELHDGDVVEMAQPTGSHAFVIGKLMQKLTFEFERLQLPYFISQQVMVSPDGYQRCYLPDITVINSAKLVSEPLWQKRSTLTLGASVPLVVEVVSSNWRDDYYTKRGAYEGLGIPEYWIADYQAIGGTQVIGKPKQPTFSVFSLVDGEYQVKQFTGGDRIQSPTLLELNLTVQQIFDAA
ncbi:MAG: Uma2 family endonuclease [Brasilonema octagenarum HA4186-MV1]|jgi:Uma2 family endonuclease|nr:Uma2 family endonuclease [Brasilonema octagenarum HA4186-MV1]